LIGFEGPERGGKRKQEKIRNFRALILCEHKGKTPGEPDRKNTKKGSKEGERAHQRGFSEKPKNERNSSLSRSVQVKGPAEIPHLQDRRSSDGQHKPFRSQGKLRKRPASAQIASESLAREKRRKVLQEPGVRKGKGSYSICISITSLHKNGTQKLKTSSSIHSKQKANLCS